MEPITRPSNEETVGKTPSRIIISNFEEDAPPLKTEENVLRIENLSSPELDRINEYIRMPSSSGSEAETKQPEIKPDDFFLDSEKPKVRFNGDAQFFQYQSADEYKNRVRFVELFDERQYEDDDSDVPNKKRKLCFGYDQLDPNCESYRLFTDMHKVKIMQVIEECFLRLADDGVLDNVLGMTVSRRIHRIRELYEYHLKSFSCRRFLLPWIMVKIIQIILCNIMMFTFVSEGTYFTRVQEFLPVVVTFYLILFLILATLLSYISCFTYSLVYNPFYMWSVIVSSILTLTSTSGIFVMLCALGYTSSYLQVTVVFLSAALISCILGELFLCYFELKRSMNQIGHSEI